MAERDTDRNGDSDYARLEARMTKLLELSSDLAQAETREQLVDLTIEKASHTLGASGAAVWMLDRTGTTLELVGASAHEAAFAPESYRSLPLTHASALAAAVRTRQPIFINYPDEYRDQFPASFARIGDALTLAPRAFALLPIAAGDVLLGGMCLAYATHRTFSDADRTFKILLARHVAVALLRIQLIGVERAQRDAAERAARAEKQARGDVELLYELTASLNRLDDIDAVYDYALRSILRIARSHRAAILLFDGEGVMRFRAHVGLSDRYRTAVEGHSPWRAGESFPAPIAVNDVETDEAWASYRDLFRAEGIRALAFVPIVHQRKLIGKFMLYRNEPLAFTARDLQLTATIAVHVAQGVERKEQERELARAYREERDAHMLAEESARAREEILSVVSHDLRNPLGTIMMGASTLLNVELGDRTQRIRTTGERIHRQAVRMARLIEDLVDFGSIQAGTLSLQRADHAPDRVLATASDILAPLAEERGIALESEVVPGLALVRCDADRVVQVLANLVTNALKVTRKGGTIAIGAMKIADEPVFYVRDAGPGIPAEELPHLFERHWRGRQTSYRGVGLGLSIARGIVDAHGGRIWAETRAEGGTTIYFALQPRAELASTTLQPVRTADDLLSPSDQEN